jgi:hypothetical protein
VAWAAANFYTLCGFGFMIASLLIACFVHNTIFSLVYLALVAVALLLGRRGFGVGAVVVSAGLTAIIAFQYCALVGFPPIGHDLAFPWSSLANDTSEYSIRLSRWLGVANYVPACLLVDSLAVFAVARLCVNNDYVLRVHALFQLPPGGTDEAERARRWIGYAKRLVLRYSYNIVLVLLFGLSTARPSVLGLGYLLFAVFFLYKGDFLLKRRNRAWRWYLLYCFGVLAAQVLCSGRGEGRKKKSRTSHTHLDYFCRPYTRSPGSHTRLVPRPRPLYSAS